MADMKKMQAIVDAHGGWDGMSDDLYNALSDLKNNGYDWDKISDKSYSVLDTANQKASSTPATPKSYQYLPGDYEDLKRNVGEVGYSGLDERQKALFKSQFPQSKFARAGGTFEDAVKYVDSQASTKPDAISAIWTGLTGRGSAMDPEAREQFMQSPVPTFVKEHPFTSAGMLASAYIPFTLGGIAGASALGAGTSLADEKLIAKEKSNTPTQDALAAGIVSGVTHGVGGKVAKELGGFASKYLNPVREYPDLVDAVKAANANAEAEHGARQWIAARIDEDAARMAREYAQPMNEEQILAELPGGLRDLSPTDRTRIELERSRAYSDAEQLAGLHRLEATKRSMWTDPKGPMVGRWENFGGAGDISDEAAEAYYNMVHSPARLAPIPPEPAGVDLVKLVNPYPGALARGLGTLVPESIRNAAIIRNAFWPAIAAEKTAVPLAQGIKLGAYPTTQVIKEVPKAYEAYKDYKDRADKYIDLVK